MVKTSGMVPGPNYLLSNVNSVLMCWGVSLMVAFSRQTGGATAEPSRTVDDRKGQPEIRGRSNGYGWGQEGEITEDRMERNEQPPRGLTRARFDLLIREASCLLQRYARESAPVPRYETPRRLFRPQFAVKVTIWWRALPERLTKRDLWQIGQDTTVWTQNLCGCTAALIPQENASGRNQFNPTCCCLRPSRRRFLP